MAKQLKIWNGRGHGLKYGKSHIYVAAYSKKQAVELINKACNAHITVNEITNYYSEGSWGNTMEGIVPTEPCVYASERYGIKPVPVKIL